MISQKVHTHTHTHTHTNAHTYTHTPPPLPPPPLPPPPSPPPPPPPPPPLPKRTTTTTNKQKVVHTLSAFHMCMQTIQPSPQDLPSSKSTLPRRGISRRRNLRRPYMIPTASRRLNLCPRDMMLLPVVRIAVHKTWYYFSPSESPPTRHDTTSPHLNHCPQDTESEFLVFWNTVTKTYYSFLSSESPATTYYSFLSSESPPKTYYSFLSSESPAKTYY